MARKTATAYTVRVAFGLGRGLESLIPSKPAKPSAAAKRVAAAAANAPRVTNEVAISDIVPNPRQPRKSFSLPELESLADSIKTHGILEPLVVSPGSTQGQFVLVAGERRLRAAELAGLAKVPVVVRETDDHEKLELALIENIQRQDLNPIEEARAFKQLIEDFKLTQLDVAKRVGRARASVTNIMRLLDLAPECQRALLEGRITAGHARALLTCPSKAQQVELLALAEAQKMSVRDVERLAIRASRAAGITGQGGRPAKEPEIADPGAEVVARKLSRHLGTRVQVVTTPQHSGRIVVEYSSEDERDRIVDQVLGAGRRTKAAAASEFTV